MVTTVPFCVTVIFCQTLPTIQLASVIIIFPLGRVEYTADPAAPKN